MSSRTCASCQREMQSFQYGGITLDGCTQCNSLWFDAGELEAFAGADRVAAVMSAALSGPQARRCKGCGEAFADSDGDRCVLCGRPAPRCPVCPASPFRVGHIRIDQDFSIEVDVCPTCRGLHLDGGELVKIAFDKSKAIEAQAVLNRIGDARFVAEEEAPSTARQNACATCRRPLEPEQILAFMGRAYCERCAPSDAQRLCGPTQTLDDVLTSAMFRVGRYRPSLGIFMDLFFK